jgi:hypothetical protein
MTRFNDILNGVKESVDAAQKTYKGIKRSDLKDSDFLFPETRSFPIVSPVDIPDAISNFGRMKGQMSYDSFLKKLYNMAKRKGPEFVAALPKATKEKLGIKTAKAESCGCNYEEDDVYPENEYQDNRLTLISDDDMEMEDEQDDPLEMEIEKLEKEIELELLKQKLMQIKKSKGQDFSQVETMEKESVEQEMMEYKNDFYEMSIGSIKSIMIHAQNILNALDKESVKENLTESWLQGKIAVTEDYMITIHNFVMFGPSETDTEAAEKRPGLWNNIRKKRERMGKTYKPAKPGDKNRPNPEQWKNLTK